MANGEMRRASKLSHAAQKHKPIRTLSAKEARPSALALAPCGRSCVRSGLTNQYRSSEVIHRWRGSGAGCHTTISNSKPMGKESSVARNSGGKRSSSLWASSGCRSRVKPESTHSKIGSLSFDIVPHQPAALGLHLPKTPSPARTVTYSRASSECLRGFSGALSLPIQRFNI